MSVPQLVNTPFSMTRDINGFNGFGLRPSVNTERTQLAANTEQHFNAPGLSSQNWIAIFSFDPGLRVFVGVNVTATVPGGSFDTVNAELNPTALQVKGGQKISLITPDTSAYVTVKFYAL